ncbi:hypothetical protein VCRA2122O339_190003 [Vibrio crassostreae]|nr:hypothetical protein VCRA2120E331_90094 [Vibrio crassostreae]CAK3155427.1 hypothetical protein VCRA2120E330_100093 [Vibrio crassostreae]CAK3300907.1 hypothetical protein VCRA2122O339_190003 [Vibrio crassostreae]CAK3646402.1 hypothetical protein VCRA2127O345_90094 [Vibrio crassostreae]CAK3683680.1 hypothetical protein VCRA2122O338_90094 [Vibrio crassostreae]
MFKLKNKGQHPLFEVICVLTNMYYSQNQKKHKNEQDNFIRNAYHCPRWLWL